MTPDDNTVSRRRFLAGAGAAGVAVALPASAEAAKKKHRAKKKPKKKTPAVKKVDVAVVGAGLCGLTAAARLQSHHLSVHVVEADTRVGGRIWTGAAKDGTPLNYGATFIGPGQDQIAALATQLGV